MAETLPSAVTSTSDWKFQQSYIERLMDHTALTSAHPDDTLIMAGPPRKYGKTAEQVFSKMLPIGMVQSMQVGQQKPTSPAMAIGTGRSFYLSGKAQGSASIGRLFVNGRNLVRALYTNAVVNGVDVTKFDDVAGLAQNGKFFANLDSELFLIPFGIAVVFRDKVHNALGAFYLELCMINSWSISVNAGSNMIMEQVSLLFDRLEPIGAEGVGEPDSRNNQNYNPSNPSDSPILSSIFDPVTAPTSPAGDNGDSLPTS